MSVIAIPVAQPNATDTNLLIDELSLAALTQSREVKTTEPGTIARRIAVRRYVVNHWPDKLSRAEIGKLFDRWVQRVRTASLRPTSPPLAGVMAAA